MTDPIADAAQQITGAAGAQPAKPEGILGEVMGAVHALEEKVEHFIHPDAQQGDAPNAAGGVSSGEQNPEADSASCATAGAAYDPGNAGQAVSGSASGATTKDGERPNDASDAAGQSESGTSSSAADASLHEGTPAASASAAKQPHPAVAKLRSWLWTFDHAAVKDLHGALDELEKLV